MASILDDVVDIETRTEIMMQKELVEKFLSTYCLGTLNESAKLTYKEVKISPMRNQKDFTVKSNFAPVTIYKYLGRSSCAFSIYRYFTLSNGNIKPLYGGRVDQMDTIIIKGYPHKQLPAYIKFEPEFSAKPLKVVLCNCTYDDIEIPGVKPENIVSVHSDRYKLYF